MVKRYGQAMTTRLNADRAHGEQLSNVSAVVTTW